MVVIGGQSVLGYVAWHDVTMHGANVRVNYPFQRSDRCWGCWGLSTPEGRRGRGHATQIDGEMLAPMKVVTNIIIGMINSSHDR